MLRQNYGTEADYFAIGVIAHELMLKRRPWPGDDRETYKENLFSYQYSLKKSDTPESWGHEASDFINKCLKRKKDQRLGLNGPMELKNHIWFRDFDWKSLMLRKTKPPFVPKKGTNFVKKDLKKLIRSKI